jgi:hypothetical protein
VPVKGTTVVEETPLLEIVMEPGTVEVLRGVKAAVKVAVALAVSDNGIAGRFCRL